VYYASPLLEQAGIPHAFSTRLGGLSPAPFDSLNLGNPGDSPVQDDRPRIEANFRLLQAAIGCQDKERCSVHQIHGCEVLSICGNQPFGPNQKADALLCDDPHRLASVRVADCVPVLLGSSDGRYVAAVHAGWRGVVAEVVPAAVAALRKRKPGQRLLAAIGPCIGFAAFEVGPEVLREFERLFGPDAPVDHSPAPKGHVDLRQAVRLQLLAGSVAPEDIDVTDRCTWRDTAEFYSHRRDNGVTGRMAALIAPRNDQSPS
jgi:YfiH family protein